MPTRLIELIERLPRSRVVLVGDFMMDRYLYGNAERLSPEAPVPVLHFQKEEVRLGGAGGVAADLAALGADVQAVGLVGADEMGRAIQEHLSARGVDAGAIITSTGRPTICKARLIGLAQHRHPQQMMRLDFEDTSPISVGEAQKVLQAAQSLVPGAAVLCIEDYNKGLLSPSVCESLIQTAASNGVPVFIDPANIPNYEKYRGATCLKLNRVETQKATGLPMNAEADWNAASSKLLADLGLEAVVITLDKSGAYLATAAGERRWLKTKPRQVYDVTGAGDMVLAMLAVARAADATWSEAVSLANVAGGLEVERFGSVPVTAAEIIQELLVEAHEHLGKTRGLDHLTAELARHRGSGKRIVFTNGCFDLIHLGHVKYFQFAKSQGDLLVVGVNTDSSIRRLKGTKRPIINEQDRMSVLEELESIDYLIRFDEDTPMRLIEAIRPDVLVKGADYAKEAVVGWDFVESNGGRVALAPLVDGRSTSAVIQRILEAYGDK